MQINWDNLARKIPNSTISNPDVARICTFKVKVKYGNRQLFQIVAIFERFSSSIFYRCFGTFFSTLIL